MDDAGLGVLGQFHEIVRQVAIEEYCHCLVVLGKLIEETDTVDDSIIVAFFYDFLDKSHVGSIPDDGAVEKLGLLTRKAYHLMTLLLEVERDEVTSHAVAA